MSRRYRSRNLDGDDVGSAIDLTPLIDMVFILLIFFLVTSSFIRESAVRIERPQAATAVEYGQTGATVTISADGQIWLNDAPVDIRLLRGAIGQMGLSANDAVLVLADAGTSTGLLISVMDQLRLAGIVNISIAANHKPESS